jgi:radical SAM superfamily enzyme YgiQ (UPF0313 family)
MGSFIIGLDVDQPGIGKRIARTAAQYGVDNLNVLFLTPLPGTRLWHQMESEGRIALNAFPEDWKYYTLTFPVARYKQLSLDGIIQEMIACNRHFYSLSRIGSRLWNSLRHRRQLLISLVGNLSSRNNIRLGRKAFADFKHHLEQRQTDVHEASGLRELPMRWKESPGLLSHSQQSDQPAAQLP